MRRWCSKTNTKVNVCIPANGFSWTKFLMLSVDCMSRLGSCLLWLIGVKLVGCDVPDGWSEFSKSTCSRLLTYLFSMLLANEADFICGAGCGEPTCCSSALKHASWCLRRWRSPHQGSSTKPVQITWQLAWQNDLHVKVPVYADFPLASNCLASRSLYEDSVTV